MNSTKKTELSQADPGAMTTAEKDSLARLERTIDAGLKTFYDVGNALAAIHDQRLYREAYKSFDDYLGARWGMRRAHGYRLIESAKVMENLSPIGDKPANEAQARELARLPADQQPTAWGDFIDDCQQHGERPTAKTLQQFIDRRLRPKTPVEPEPDAPPLLDGKPEPTPEPTPEPPSCRILTGDCRDMLRTLDTGSVHCVVTSPPYHGLRDYGTGTWEGGDPDCDHKPKASPRESRPSGGLTGGKSTIDAGTILRHTCHCGARRIDSQIGMEPTVEEYVAHLVEAFREVRRVLRDDGTLYLNLGDSFIDKQLQGIPWRVAFALQADGWYLRNDVVWHKPSPMPESATDRFTRGHEFVFLLTKRDRYFFDQFAVQEPAKYPNDQRGERGDSRRGSECNAMNGRTGSTRNRRDVWSIATEPSPIPHFAMFPRKLVEPCILAGTSERGCCADCGAPWQRIVEKHPAETTNPRPFSQPGNEGDRNDVGRVFEESVSVTIGWQPTCGCGAGTEPCTVLDPFCGVGTAGLVAVEHGRGFLGIELSPEHAGMAERRIARAMEF